MQLILAFQIDEKQIIDKDLINNKYPDFITAIRQICPNIIHTVCGDDTDEIWIKVKDKDGNESESLVAELPRKQ